MAIEFRCSGCTTRLKAPDNSSGKRVKCPKCASIQTIPGAKPAEEVLGPKPIAPAPKPAPAQKPIPAAKPKLAPVQAEHVTPQIAPLASSSPFGDLDALANMDLTSGPSVQMAATVLPPSDSVPSVEYREPAPPPTKKQGSTGLLILKIPAIIMILQSIFILWYSLSLMLVVVLAFSSGKLHMEDLNDAPVSGRVLPQVAAAFFIFVFQIIIVRGAIYMLSARNYAAAKVGAIVATIPCFGYLAFPFGILAWIMLANDSIKNSFKS